MRGAGERKTGWWAVAAAGLAALGCVSVRPYEEVAQSLEPSRLLTLGGTRVYVEDVGEGPPIVLVHGFGESTYTWRHVIPRLTNSYRVIALDLHGFGYTERPPGVRPYTRDGQLELLLGVLDRLGLESAHWVGHSYGGGLVTALAATRPEAVRSLVLVNSTRPEYTRARRSAFARLKPLVAGYVRFWALRPGPLRRALERSVADDRLITGEVLDGYRDRLLVEGAAHGFYGLTVPWRGERDDVDVDSIRAPALVIWGEEDALIDLDTGRQVAAALPEYRFVTLEGVGHNPPEEAPGEVAGWIDRFVGALETRSPAN